LTTGKHARPHYLTEDKGKHRPQFAEPLRGRQRKDDGKGAEEAEVKGGECVSGGNGRASGTEPTGTAGRLWPTRRCTTITTVQTIIALHSVRRSRGRKETTASGFGFTVSWCCRPVHGGSRCKCRERSYGGTHVRCVCYYR